MKKKYGIYTLLLLLPIFLSCKGTIEKTVITEEKKPVFNHVPTKPINGKLLGVVELGAAGFNSFIINVDKDLNWEYIKKEYGTSLIVEGMTNTALVNQKLRDYINSILSFGLAKEDIYFVVSSGAAKEEITKIISNELENIGYTVNSVSVEQEGAYALKSVVPKEYINTSFIVDIGSGNTKISYFNENGTPVILETHGAKYYQKGIEDITVFEDVKKETAKIPLIKKSRCFMIGGVPTELARLIKKEEKKYTILNSDPEKFNSITVNGGKKLQSGFNIYKAIKQESMANYIIYDADGNFTVGFLLDKITKQ